MAIIPRESVEQVLQATDIVELVSSYLPLKRAGAQFRANCPFHNEKTPSFYVNPARQSFKCFGCGAGGDAITFVKDYENLPFPDAVRRLAQRVGVQIREEVEDPEAEKARRSKGRLLDLHREATEFFHRLLMKSSDAAHARDYLKSRGYGAEMAKSWHLGWMPENPEVFLSWARERKYLGRELKDSGMCFLRDENNPRSGLGVRFRDRLMFPIRNEIGDVIAYSGRQLRENPNSGKYVNSPESPLFVKSRVLYALDRARKPILNEKAALLCEGQLDVIACHEAGVTHALAPLGTAFTETHARLLKRYTSHVVACYDADNAGVNASEKLFRVLCKQGLSMRVVCLPEGLDPDDYLQRYGAEEFRELLSEAKEFFDFKLDHAGATGQLEQPASRNKVLADCAGILAKMSDMAARENAINSVASGLRASAQSLRAEIKRIHRRPQRRYQEGREEEGGAVPVEATSLHRVVAYLCDLALRSPEAQYFLADQFESLHEAGEWLEGVPLLQSVLAAAPDATSPAAVNAFLATLSEPDRLALSQTGADDGGQTIDDGLKAAEEALGLLSAIVLQKKDAAVKAALKEPGLAPEKMIELIEQSKEIAGMLRGIEQRIEFDDELPKSTYKPRKKQWKGNRGQSD